MGKHGSSREAAARQAWRVLRLALLWARKGGLLRCRMAADYLKGLNKQPRTRPMIRYSERQLSFDSTPVIHLRMSRPTSLRFMIPCIKPDVVDDEVEGYGERSLNAGDDDENDDEEIDVKAEEFIAKFYEQIKLQRQISYKHRLNVVI